VRTGAFADQIRGCSARNECPVAQLGDRLLKFDLRVHHGRALRHFPVENSAAGRHPLHVTGTKRPAIPETVAMVHRPPQDIGDGLDAAVGMPGKPGAVIVRAVIAKIVQQQIKGQNRRCLRSRRLDATSPRPLPWSASIRQCALRGE
jgi:hypothetical protein